MGKIISNGIEYGGLTNINGVFIDTNNIIQATTSYMGTASYTATQDCFVVASISMPTDGSGYIAIDGVTLFSLWSTTSQNIRSQYYTVLVKKGQTVTLNARSDWSENYTVYGIQQGSTNQGSSGGIDYSTTEQKTGQKWIDGKDIYQKTYAIDISESQTGTVLISDYDYIVKIEAVLNNNSFAFPIFTLASSDYFVAFVDKSTNLLTVLRDAGSSHTGIAYVTVQYTKSTT